MEVQQVLSTPAVTPAPAVTWLPWGRYPAVDPVTLHCAGCGLTFTHGDPVGDLTAARTASGWDRDTSGNDLCANCSSLTCCLMPAPADYGTRF